MTKDVSVKPYTIDEVSQLLGIGRNAAYEAARRGGAFPIIRVGKRILVPRAAFDRLLAEGAPKEGKAA